METMVIMPGGLFWWACAIYVVAAVIGIFIAIFTLGAALAR
jgi:hypothetical protein